MNTDPRKQVRLPMEYEAIVALLAMERSLKKKERTRRRLGRIEEEEEDRKLVEYLDEEIKAMH